MNRQKRKRLFKWRKFSNLYNRTAADLISGKVNRRTRRAKYWGWIK